MENGLFLIVKERNRQQSVSPIGEGYTAEHDDQFVNGELAMVAVCYILNATFSFNPERGKAGIWWPFTWDEKESWKPKDRITDLVRAGALIAAEIDRLERMKDGNDNR